MKTLAFILSQCKQGKCPKFYSLFAESICIIHGGFMCQKGLQFAQFAKLILLKGEVRLLVLQRTRRGCLKGALIRLGRNM